MSLTDFGRSEGEREKESEGKGEGEREGEREREGINRRISKGERTGKKAKGIIVPPISTL
jgi:hypothetical protein